MLVERRDTAAARKFFKRAVGTNRIPDRIVIDIIGVNLAGLQSLNVILKVTGSGKTIKIIQSKYLNNVVEQDHRFINRIARPMLGFKALHLAASTLAGTETTRMIREGQLGENAVSPFKQFAGLAAQLHPMIADFQTSKYLRQNPPRLNIITMGKIRDAETTGLACRVALMDRLVRTTLLPTHLKAS